MNKLERLLRYVKNPDALVSMIEQLLDDKEAAFKVQMKEGELLIADDPEPKIYGTWDSNGVLSINGQPICQAVCSKISSDQITIQ